jgi:hypothetical protein
MAGFSLGPDIIRLEIKMPSRLQPFTLICATAAVLFLPGSTVPQTSRPASLTGVVQDCGGGVVPGAVVMLTDATNRKILEPKTGKNGRYRFDGIPAGIYALEARSPSPFLPFKRTGIQVTAGSVVGFDISLQVDRKDIRVVLTVPAVDLPALWMKADAVVHLRIQKTVGTRPRPTRSGCECMYTEHQAIVLEAFRRHIGEPKSNVGFLQASYCPVPDDLAGPEFDRPFDTGGEFIAFLKWNGKEEMFQSHVMVPVRNGQVKSSCIHGLESGMSLEAYLKILRAMME